MIKKSKSGSRKLPAIRPFAILAVLGLLACPFAVASAADIRIGGAAESCNGMFEVISEQIRDETGITPLISPSSSAQALLDLDRGVIDIATTDVPLENIVRDLEKRGYLVVPENFQVQGIGTNTILVYLNRGNGVTALSQEQLRDIFSGKITNWKQVGGENRKIVVVWGDETPDQNRLFTRYVIGSRPLARSAVRATGQQDIIRRVIGNPGAIGIASHVYKSGRTRNPRTPFVSSKVIAITRGIPSDDAQKLLEVVKSYDF